MNNNKTIWGITDGSAGMKSQVEGVCTALGLPYELKTCKRRWPFYLLPAGFSFGALKQLTSDSDKLTAPWPDAVITSGRRSAALGLAVKAASGGKTKAVHITDPRSGREKFDLIVAMEHDAAEGPNVIKTSLALHRLTQETLAAARAQWEPVFAHLPKPWIAVLIGGSTHRYKMGVAEMRQVVAMIKGVLRRESGSLLVTTSRRTGDENVALLRESFIGESRTWLYDEHGDNPYLGLLACADYIIVTEDSVNMLSEAAYTGKPIYIVPMPGLTGKPIAFAEKLLQCGIAKRLDQNMLNDWKYNIIDEQKRVAKTLFQLI